MRKLNYVAVAPNGTTFTTTSFTEATSAGNKISKTFLTEIDTRSDKIKEATKKHALKFQEKMRKKRG